MGFRPFMLLSISQVVTSCTWVQKGWANV